MPAKRKSVILPEGASVRRRLAFDTDAGSSAVATSSADSVPPSTPVRDVGSKVSFKSKLRLEEEKNLSETRINAVLDILDLESAQKKKEKKRRRAREGLHLDSSSEEDMSAYELSSEGIIPPIGHGAIDFDSGPSGAEDDANEFEGFIPHEREIGGESDRESGGEGGDDDGEAVGGFITMNYNE